MQVAVNPCKRHRCKDPTWDPVSLADCWGDDTGAPERLRGMLCPVLAEICGTPGYLAPEILQCSMDDEHQGYGKEVDM